MSAWIYYILFIVAIGLWLVWHVATNDLFNVYVVYIAMVVLCGADLILLIFTYDKLTAITAVTLGVFFFVSILGNLGLISRSGSGMSTMENRRMTIDLWQDVLIDMAYLFLVIQITVLLKP